MATKETVTHVEIPEGKEMSRQEFDHLMNALAYEAGTSHGMLTFSLEASPDNGDREDIEPTVIRVYASGYRKHIFNPRARNDKACALCDFRKDSDVHIPAFPRD